MNGVSTLALSYVGLVALALAMDRHQTQAFGKALSLAQTRQARVLGWLLVLAAAVPAVQGWGASVGISLWLGAISLAAVACGLVFSYVPKQAVGSGLLLAVIGGGCLLL